jgi:hypothetical protein
MKQIKTFETYDVDLAAYLMLQGLKFIECKLDDAPGTKPRVIMRFFDEKEAARDLEKVFMGSPEKKYRDFHKYLLRDIHRTLKGI